MVAAIVILSLTTVGLAVYCIVLRKRGQTQLGSAAGRTREIAVTESQLMKIAQQAGMAELHEGILNNIYNILNTVNVSASVVSDKIDKLEVKSLVRIAGLLKQQGKDIGVFLESERGRKVPEAIIQLSEFMANAHSALRKEIANLNNIIQRLNQIVKAQQAYAGVHSSSEEVDINHLLEDAITMEFKPLQDSHIQVRKETHPVPSLNIPKIKILQVVVTLIRNAVETMRIQCPEDDRILYCRTHEKDGLVTIEIGDPRAIDEGELIDPLASPSDSNTLTRRHFSLFYCANAVSEMNGTIKIYCEGPSYGAMVLVNLPSKSIMESLA